MSICGTPDLVRNPFSNFTLQCRKYKKSDKIMKKSEHIYNKFKSMFLIGEGENFAAVSFYCDTSMLTPLISYQIFCELKIYRFASLQQCDTTHWHLITIIHVLFPIFYSGVCKRSQRFPEE